MLCSKAKSKYIKISPRKLRLIVDVIRGNNVSGAMSWLQTHAMNRVVPVRKTLVSAYSNAKQVHADKVSMDNMFIKEIKVDQGPVIKYFKPGAMGRANPQRRRQSHLEIVLEKREIKTKVKK